MIDIQLIDPELRENARAIPFNRFVISTGNLFLKLSWQHVKIPAGITLKTLTTKSPGALTLETTVFSPENTKENTPALIYVHGGGFAYNAAPYQKELAMIYAGEAGCRVFFPHYHLAPKYTYPAAYEDVLSLYRYVAAHADELGVDKEQVGLAGDSAGASIAALVCNRWEEEKIIPPCLQMLVYPVTDAEMKTDSMKRFTDTPQWNSLSNRNMWSYYCKDDQELMRSASPMHCTLPRKMPGTYIETAQYDCLHDEGILYAKKLSSAGTKVEINETEGTFHGYDVTVDAQIVRRNIDRRVSFLKAGFRAGS